jgi:hypothetical protein
VSSILNPNFELNYTNPYLPAFPSQGLSSNMSKPSILSPTPSYNFAANPNVDPGFLNLLKNPSTNSSVSTALNSNKRTPTFFENGNDLGFNLDTFKFGTGMLGGIMSILGANQYRKALASQQAFAARQLANAEKAYDTNIVNRAQSAYVLGGGTDAQEKARIGLAALDSKGVGGDLRGSLLARAGLAPAKRDDDKTSVM